MYCIEILKRKNSRKYTPIKELKEIDDVVNYMKENKLKFAGTPYVFTHIELSDKSIVTQNYNGVVCSPEELRKVLTS